MFSILGRPTRLCDGLNRREMLRIGGLSALGLSLPGLLQAAEGPPPGIIEDPTFGAAKSVIFVWLQGGPPQHETFDPKPEAPAEIRGPFKPINTNVPGIDFCELLPRTARIADKLAVCRSIATDSNVHSVSGYEVLTGYKYRGPNARTITPDDWPYFGSLVKMLKPSEKLPPLSSVWLPRKMHLNESVTPAGQTAGFLGDQWDPDRFVIDPSNPESRVEGLDLNSVAPLRMRERMSLLEQVERHFSRLELERAQVYGQFQQQAFDLLLSGKVKAAFEVDREKDQLRDRYGRFKWGQCLLLARRLVEAGVRLVHVNWAREPGDSAVDNPMWDTHALNADRVEDVLCPMFDVGFTALVEDLDQRGLLHETLVVAIGEFGRTPKINDRGGRDHWGSVFSFALAGAGVQTAQVLGASDKTGGHPARDRVSPADLTATIFHLLGVRHDGTFRDRQQREHRITTGEPIRALLGERPATKERLAAGGSIARVPPYDASLLLNMEFTQDVPLLTADHGSRPKGWRAAPLVEEAAAKDVAPQPLSVSIATAEDSSGGKPYARLTVGGIDGRPGKAAQGAQAVLGQEMRSPRLGKFTFQVDACATASSSAFYNDVFLKHFACRLVIFRYAELSKDPRKREEFLSQVIRPPLAEADSPRPERFTLEKVLDSQAPGQNFPIGKGFGIAILLEKTTPGDVALPEGQSAELQIHKVSLEFNSRTINDKVKV